MVDDPQSANDFSSGSTGPSFGSPSAGQPSPDASSWGQDPSNPSDWMETAQQQAAMGWTMAQFWITQNQSKAMLGAFAVGTFVGAMLRD